MEAMSSFHALILDLGEVLVHPQPPELIGRMAELAGAPLPAFTAAYWAHRPAYDLHGSHRRFWAGVLAECRSPLAAPAREAAAVELFELDVRSWTVYREDLWRMAADFRAAGGKLALVSNCAGEIIDRVRAKSRWARTYDAVVVSSEVGSLKPEPDIFRIALSRLGVEPGESLFVDDRAVNVAGAEAVGMQALHFTGDGSMPALRARLGLGGG
jgi:putative hydrolase of the HAD superfamily